MFDFYYIDIEFDEFDWEDLRDDSASLPQPSLINKPIPALGLDNIVSSPAQQDYG